MSESEKKLHAAIAEFLGKRPETVQAASIGTIATRVVGLISGRWEHLVDLGLADDNDGHVTFGISVKMSVSSKCPTGSVTLRFSQRTEDQTEFVVEDPDQRQLPFAAAIGRPPTQPTPEPVALPASASETNPAQRVVGNRRRRPARATAA